MARDDDGVEEFGQSLAFAQQFPGTSVDFHHGPQSPIQGRSFQEAPVPFSNGLGEPT